MVDFSSLLKAKAGEAKKPPALPIGDYPGVIKSREFGDQNKNKTPYVRFAITMTDFPEEVDREEVQGVDLSKRSFRKDFYLTEDALWRLDDFLKSCGTDPKGMTYEEAIEGVIGASVLCKMEQYAKQGSDETGNSLGQVVGTP